MIRRPPRSPLFPNTTLFRSERTGRFQLLRDSQYWLRNRADGPRRAGLSSMSVDGNCLHAILEGVEKTDPSLPALTQRLDRSEEHTSELQSQSNLVCRLLLEK